MCKDEVEVATNLGNGGMEKRKMREQSNAKERHGHRSQERTERCRENYMRAMEKAGYERDEGPKRPGRARRRGEKYERRRKR
jgi:hypothetical protein